MKNQKVNKTGVIQPLPGIGDMTWLLPALKAIAKTTPTHKIILFTRASAQADKLLAAEDWVEQIVLLPNARGILAGVSNLFFTWLALRRHPLDRVYILHKSRRYQTAAQLAAVPKIRAYSRDLAKTKDYGWAKSLTFLDQLGIPVIDRHAHLSVKAESVTPVRQRFASCPQPWFVIAPGASEPVRCWPVDRFAACADALATKQGGTIFLTGAPREAERIAAVYRLCQNVTRLVPVSDLPLDQFMGLLTCSVGLFGNDSGPTNLAAVLERPAFTLYGVTPLVPHSPHLIPITPDLPPDQGKGMERISAQHALDIMFTRLSQLKDRKIG